MNALTAAIAIALVVASSAGAAPVVCTFTGTVTEVFGTLPSLGFNSAAAGDAVSFIFHYDDATLDVYPDPNQGYYNNSVHGVELTIGAESYVHNSPFFSRVVVNDLPLNDSVSYAYQFYEGPALFALNAFAKDTTGTVFSSDALPASLDISDFDVRIGQVFDYADNIIWIEWSGVAITADAAIVPLPTGAGLGFAGLGALGLRRRR